MSRKSKGGGWRRPPREGLIGRSEAALILQCDRTWISRYYQKQGLLRAAVTEPDGVEWFEREAVLLLASSEMKRRGRKRSGTRLRAVRAPSPSSPSLPTEAPEDGGYYPELGARRAPLAAVPRPPVKARARPSAPRTPLPKGIGPRTEIPKEWFDEDLTALDPSRAAPAAPRASAPSGSTEIDPKWFDPDYTPEADGPEKDLPVERRSPSSKRG